MEPTAAPLDLPESYGRPRQTMRWDEVRDRLERATHYWIATVRADGRPHVVPKDGLWLDDTLYFGGGTDTVNHRNLAADGRVVAHVGAGGDAILVEGRAEWLRPGEEQARELAQASKAKYGYAPAVETYQQGLWALRPERVIAWTRFPIDATRFSFGD